VNTVPCRAYGSRRSGKQNRRGRKAGQQPVPISHKLQSHRSSHFHLEPLTPNGRPGDRLAAAFAGVIEPCLEADGDGALASDCRGALPFHLQLGVDAYQLDGRQPLILRGHDIREHRATGVVVERVPLALAMNPVADEPRAVAVAARMQREAVVAVHHVARTGGFSARA